MNVSPLCDNCEFRAESRIKDYCDNPDSPNYKKSPMINQKACYATEQKEKTQPSVIELMKHNIHAYNKHMTRKYLRKKTPLELLQLVHETERREFAIALCKAGLCETHDVEHYLKH